MFHTFFYEPVYNLIVIILTAMPLHDIGATIIVVTLIIKGLLLPFNLSALRTQYAMKRIEPEMKRIKELQKKDPTAASQQMVAMYKREKVNPFSSLFAMMLQIPIFFALYFVFSKGLFSDATSLYSFVTFPTMVHTHAFGLFDITKKNIILAVFAGISSHFLARRQSSTMGGEKKNGGDESFQEQFMKSMRIQMLYVLPVIIIFSGAVLPAALSLYWTISNIASIGLDVYTKNKLAHLKPAH